MAKEVSLKRLVSYWPLYLFILPSVALVATFAYFPAFNAMYHAFFRWNGDYINIFVGVDNFKRALGQPLYWVLATVLLALVIRFGKTDTKFSDFIKAAAGILTPLICLTSLLRMGKALQPTASITAAAVPIAAVWALFAYFTFLMDKESDARPTWIGISGTLLLVTIARALGLAPIAAWSSALLLVGVLLHGHPQAHKLPGLHIFKTMQALLALGMALWALGAYAGGDDIFWKGFSIISILVVANLFKMLPSITTAVVIHRLKSDTANYWYRVLFVIPMIIPGMVYLLIWKFFFEPTGVLNLILNKTCIMTVLGGLDKLFGWGGLFATGATPAWLNDTSLVLPAFILWGFPWVGVVGVLIYLAGLQSIDTSVYEASDLDGATAFQKFLHIEFPLILTQVRINLVLMIIGTLQMYGFVLILFGVEGGPNGRMMVPGLYMFRQAFVERYTGYACCIGLILFVFILLLTELNNRFVRVEK